MCHNQIILLYTEDKHKTSDLLDFNRSTRLQQSIGMRLRKRKGKRSNAYFIPSNLRELGSYPITEPEETWVPGLACGGVEMAQQGALHRDAS